ncbi:hypothetical protein AGMMS50233_10540 [Endomicrobiia bacterium]|nr:hypothetical protein AGMMS50233_10540 [Endomicrobiia bacterium]
MVEDKESCNKKKCKAQGKTLENNLKRLYMKDLTHRQKEGKEREV